MTFFQRLRVIDDDRIANEIADYELGLKQFDFINFSAWVIFKF